MVGLCEGGRPEPPTRSFEKLEVGDSEPLLVTRGLEDGPRVGLAGDGGTGGGGRGLLAAGFADELSTGWCCSLSSDTMGFHDDRSAAVGDGGVVGEDVASFGCWGLEDWDKCATGENLTGLYTGRSPFFSACCCVSPVSLVSLTMPLDCSMLLALSLWLDDQGLHTTQ